MVQGRRTHFRWFVLAFIFLIYAIASADRANIGIALPYMQKEFGLSNTEIGSIVSLFGLSYGIFQIPAAFLIRQFGVSAVMPPFMILTSIFAATLGAVGSALLLQLNRLALGIAEAPLANSLMTTVVNNWFPPREKGQAAGIFISSAKFGPVIVPPIGAAIILHFGCADAKSCSFNNERTWLSAPDLEHSAAWSPEQEGACNGRRSPAVAC